MGNIRVFQASPQCQQIEGFADYGAETWNLLSPAQSARKAGIHRNQPGFHVRIVLPIAQQEVRQAGAFVRGLLEELENPSN